jgi:adenosylmethionine---8-amino-7-oxononanoate aminotransferase
MNEMTKARAARLEETDRTVLWHPFTQMKDYARTEPLIIERGKGSYLIDIHGRRYLDGISSLWVNVHGHRKREIDRAMIDQIRRVSHSTLLGISHVSAVELAEALVKIVPRGLTRVFYSDNGSTGVEVALKMAFQSAQASSRRKKKFICFTNGYHGDTLGSVSVGGIDLFHKVYGPLLFPAIKTESPYCYRCALDRTCPRCGMECLNFLEERMRSRRAELAGLIVEPLVQGAGGMIVFPQGFLKGVRSLCTKYGVLMIADEVATGFGRTGKMFACDHEKVTPDLMVMSKGITGGYLPLAATVATDEVFEAFLGEVEESKTFFHGHSFTGNPIACRAALANLQLFRDERVIEKLPSKIRLLSKELKKFRQLPAVGDIRQKGLMIGIELVSDRATKTPFPVGKRIGQKVVMEARERGVIVRPLGDVIVLMPPLSISEREIEKLSRVIFESITAAVS